MSARSLRASVARLEHLAKARAVPRPPVALADVPESAEDRAQYLLAAFGVYGLDADARRMFAAGSGRAGPFCVDAVRAVAEVFCSNPPRSDGPFDACIVALLDRYGVTGYQTALDPGVASEAHSALWGFLMGVGDQMVRAVRPDPDDLADGGASGRRRTETDVGPPPDSA